LWTLLIIHLLLYPASNGYNSYFDKDEKSIGGLKNPPPVSTGLYFLALLLDSIAVLLGYLKISATFAIMLFIYGLVSKAYSHPSIRIKKYPIAGWVITGVFQGLFTFLMCYVGVNKYPIELAIKSQVIIPGILSTVMLLANYPMTQVYQHEEDAKRGDKTLSLMLGVKGTFLFVGGVFTAVAVGFVLYFNTFFGRHYAITFLLALSPVMIYFLWWFGKVLKNESNANYQNTMWLNFISATCLNAFFIYLFLSTTQVAQVLQ
jgi:1,4-dihydroxy-2-naphthoate octaprenyltransferase